MCLPHRTPRHFRPTAVSSAANIFPNVTPYSPAKANSLSTGQRQCELVRNADFGIMNYDFDVCRDVVYRVSEVYRVSV